MDHVTVRELRNNGGAVVNRVLAGETLLVTRDGHAVAEIAPVRRAGLTADELVRRARHLPPIDAARFRRDVDTVLDQRL